ncbi:hypothetical protein C8Q76DRAFT_792776 [Earliella scabrosa]|nr:hypothetical protein C8Q76DRAFT_792776 [Earliella scabrosa]
MSSDAGSDEVAELISTYQILFVDNACAFAVLALVIYDYAITLGAEIDLFWTRKPTGATALFVLNRYLLVLDYIFNIATIERSSEIAYVPCGSESPPSSSCSRALWCAVLVKVENATYNLQYVPWAAFGALRAYALSQQNLPVAVLVGLLTLVPFGLNMSQFGSGLTGTLDPIFGCTEVLPVDPAMAKKCKLAWRIARSPECMHAQLTTLDDAVTIAARTTLIAADLILIGVTWRSVPRRKDAMRLTSSFAGVLFRNGMVYFLVLFVLNALHLIFTMVSASPLKSYIVPADADAARAQIVDPLNPVSNVTIFTLPITAVLVSRFLLDLQHANRKTLHLDSGADSYADSDRGRGGGGSIVFERVVGSIASSIEPGGYYEDEDEDGQGGGSGERGEGKDSDVDVEMRALEGHQGEESSSGSVSGSGADQPEGDGEMQFVVPATPPPLSQVR